MPLYIKQTQKPIFLYIGIELQVHEYAFYSTSRYQSKVAMDGSRAVCPNCDEFLNILTQFSATRLARKDQQKD